MLTKINADDGGVFGLYGGVLLQWVSVGYAMPIGYSINDFDISPSYIISIGSRLVIKRRPDLSVVLNWDIVADAVKIRETYVFYSTPTTLSQRSFISGDVVRQWPLTETVKEILVTQAGQLIVRAASDAILDFGLIKELQLVTSTTNLLSLSLSTITSDSPILNNTPNAASRVTAYIAIALVVFGLVVSAGVAIGLRRYRRNQILKRDDKNFSFAQSGSSNPSHVHQVNRSHQLSQSNASQATEVVTIHELSIPGFMELEWGVDFTRGEYVAKGGTGAIYQCHANEGTELIQRSRKTRLAVKTIPQTLMTEGMMAGFYQELSLMYRFRDHGNFVKVYGYCVQPLVGLIMKYYELGTLDKFIENQCVANQRFPYSKWTVVDMLKQFLTGVRFMHENDIGHCDIKPSNILLDASLDETSLVPIISDFGVSQILNRQGAQVAGFQFSPVKGASVAFAGPEVLFQLHNRRFSQFYTSQQLKAGDIYASAIVMYEMLTRLSAWE